MKTYFSQYVTKLGNNMYHLSVTVASIYKNFCV